MFRRSGAIVRHDLRILRRDPVFLVIMIGMPLVMMVFFRDTYRLSLQAAGYAGATGAEQAVPGGIVMFSTFLVGNVAFSVFREHGYGTWDRLRASPASTAELIAGKSVVPLLSIAVQTIVLFAVGLVAFDLRVSGSMAGVALVAVAHWLCLVAIGLFLLAVCRTIQQVNAASNLGAMVLAGFGGAFTPIESLPSWARHVAPATPHYWAMRGFRRTILDGDGIASTLPSLAVLLSLTVAFVALAARRFNADERKLSWA